MSHASQILTRRRLLALALSASAGALVGCGESDDGSSDANVASAPGSTDAAEQGGNQVAGATLVGMLRTRWRADPWAKGSYSFMSRDASPEDRVALRAPIEDRLVIAGEATSTDYPATVHGALLSGIDAAGVMVAAGVGRVIVVGAGACGLAAASALADEGIEVVVVEARDRIGGRVWTNDDLGFPVDLGGSWIHGVDENPLTQLAAEAGADLHAFDYDDVDLHQLGGDDDSFEDVVEIEQEFGADVDQLGPDAMSEGEEFGGGDALLPGGYLELLEQLGRTLDLRLTTPVSAVTLLDDGVTVDANGEQFVADSVIVTVPLGVLKADAIEFNPPLPRSHQGAIGRLGMGLLDKLVLQFDRPFWPEDVAMLGLVTAARGEWTTWVNLLPVAGVPALMGFSAGSVGERFSEMSDDALVVSALATLRAAYE